MTQLIRNSRGELKVDGINERMKRTLQTSEGRQKLAEFIVSGNGRLYTRSQIKIRIQKVAKRLARRFA